MMMMMMMRRRRRLRRLNRARIRKKREKENGNRIAIKKIYLFKTYRVQVLVREVHRQSFQVENHLLCFVKEEEMTTEQNAIEKTKKNEKKNSLFPLCPIETTHFHAQNLIRQTKKSQT